MSSEVVAAKEALESAAKVVDINRVQYDNHIANITSLENTGRLLKEARIIEEANILKLEEALRLARANVEVIKADEIVVADSLAAERTSSEVLQYRILHYRFAFINFLRLL
jgi:hypothetical protein